MAMVGVDDSRQQVDLQPKPVGLVSGLAASQHHCTVIRWNSHNDFFMTTAPQTLIIVIISGNCMNINCIIIIVRSIYFNNY